MNFSTLTLAIVSSLEVGYSFQSCLTNPQQISTALFGTSQNKDFDRRAFISNTAAMASSLIFTNKAQGVTDLDRLDVEDFLKTGMVSQPMGVSGQAGKTKPELGVKIRDGTEIARDKRTGNVLAEIVLQKPEQAPTAVYTSFTSPWPLATSSVFGIECRDSNTGDSAFVAVSENTNYDSIQQVPNFYIINQLFNSKTGRFSSYGTPTDIKLKPTREGDIDSYTAEDGMVYKLLEVNFSTLSQSTQTEIPRTAYIAATIPNGLDQVVMLVGSATTLRWKKSSNVEKNVKESVKSFRTALAPKTGLKVRVKD